LAEGRDRREELERLVTNPERNRVPKKLEKKLEENIKEGGGGCCHTCAGCMYCFVPSCWQEHLATISGETYRLGYVHSTWTNVWLLLRRFLTLQVQDPFIFWVRALLIITMGFLVGFIFFQVDDSYEAIQDRISAYFFMILVTTFVSLTALPSAIEERVVVMHEFKTGTYRLVEYAIANILSRLPAILLINSVFIILAYWLMGVGNSARIFWTFYAIIIITNMVGECFMMAVGAFSPNSIIGVAVGITVYGLWMLTSGGILPSDRMWIALRWMNYFSYYKYAIESMLLSSFPPLTFGCPTIISGIPSTCEVTGDEVLDVNYDKGGPYFLPNEWVGIGCLVVWFFLFAFLYYGALLWQAWPSRSKYINRVLDAPWWLLRKICCCFYSNDDMEE
jgi:ABC-type multidrug transport system permease subunit